MEWMLINLLTGIALFFIQPVFWLGLIVAVIRSQRRLHYERKHFNHAVYKNRFEVRNYLTKGLIPGLLLSFITLIVGMAVPLEWVVLYQLMILALFIFGERFIHPIFSFSITTLLLFLLPQFGLNTYISHLPFARDLNFSVGNLNFLPLSLTILFLIIFFLFLGNWSLEKKENLALSPQVYETKRGKLSVRYAADSLTVIPLLIIVPGEGLGSWFDWWPVFDIGAEQYSFLVLPVLTGFMFYLYSHSQETLKKHIPSAMKTSIILLALGGIGIIYFVPEYIGIIFILALVLGLVTYNFAHYKEQKHASEYQITDKGVTIIGVRPDSPAGRIGLKVGDTILDINGESINNGEAFNRELARNRLYAHLRIQQSDGNIILKETAVYENDAYDLGIILLSHYAHDNLERTKI